MTTKADDAVEAAMHEAAIESMAKSKPFIECLAARGYIITRAPSEDVVERARETVHPVLKEHWVPCDGAPHLIECEKLTQAIARFAAEREARVREGIITELQTVKWIGSDAGWDKAVAAITAAIRAGSGK